MTTALFFLLLAAGAQAADYRIAGVLVNELTGAPVEGARVSLLPGEPGREPEIAIVTGPDGRFRFDRLPPGKYTMMAVRRGYVPMRYGERPSRAGVAIVTGPGEKPEQLVFRYSPAAAIGGRVTDEAGEPVKEALVQLLLKLNGLGRKITLGARWTYTNDEGEYRFPMLRAGLYYLAVTAEPWYAGNQSVMGIEGAAFASRFYPGVGDPKSAVPLRLLTGQQAVADFSLLPVKGVTVRVVVEHAGRQHIRLTAEGVDGNDLFVRVQEKYGTTEFRGVPAGRYYVTAVSPDGEPRTRRQQVDVGGEDVEVKLQPQTPLVVAGKVAVNGPKPERCASAVVYLRDVANNQAISRELGPGGVFAFSNVAAKRYVIGLGGAKECYLEGVTIGGNPVKDRELNLSESGGVQLDLRVRTDGGRVSGKAWRGADPVPGETIMLAPRAESSDPANYHLFNTDSDGSFDFEAVKPGEYDLFPIPDESALDYTDPVQLQPHRTRGQQVTVEPNTAVTRRVELPPLPENGR